MLTLQALSDLLREPQQVRAVKDDLLSIILKPRLPQAHAAAADAAAEAAPQPPAESLVRRLCDAEACLRSLAAPLRPSVLDRMLLLDLTRTLSGLEPGSLQVVKFEADLKVGRLHAGAVRLMGRLLAAAGH